MGKRCGWATLRATIIPLEVVVMHFFVPSTKGQASNTFSYQVQVLWNALPNSLQSPDKKHDFKNKLKKPLLDKMEKDDSNMLFFINFM